MSACDFLQISMLSVVIRDIMETGCGFLLLYHVLNLGGKQHQISSGNFGVGVRGLGLLLGGGGMVGGLYGCTIILD